MNTKNNLFFYLFVILWVVLFEKSKNVLASDLDLIPSLKVEIGKLYPGARVDIDPEIRWIREESAETQSNTCRLVSVVEDDFKGNIHFLLKEQSLRACADGWVGFEAWVPTQIALRRIHPGEVLNQDYFSPQSTNIAKGQGRDYRGILFPQKMAINGLEAIQTILEGQFLLTSSVQKMPDIRRGDSVRIQVVSGGLTLSTSGTAEEPGYIDRKIRVMTAKTKRELVGQLKSDGIVEVTL